KPGARRRRQPRKPAPPVKITAGERGEPVLRARKLQLAALLHISRPTLDHYLSIPGAPTADDGRAYDVANVAAWVAQHAKTAGASEDGQKFRTDKVRLEAEGLAFDLAVKRGEYFRRADAAPIVAGLASELVATLRQQFEQELPPRMVGKSLVEIQAIGAEGIDLVLRTFKRAAGSLTL
ncbi:MAG: hypothetical protein KGJ95_10280, partial [Candidatus Omnitrophica bacterium]|nr:hypothetical protein [Candidatus Omnitrophota bacterium]